jgi:hypothetical protein
MEKVRENARRPADRRGRWLIDDLQLGHADLVVLSRLSAVG